MTKTSFHVLDLAAVPTHALKPEGFMAVVGSGMLLPQMLKHLEHEGLTFIMEVNLVPFQFNPDG